MFLYIHSKKMCSPPSPLQSSEIYFSSLECRYFFIRERSFDNFRFYDEFKLFLSLCSLMNTGPGLHKHQQRWPLSFALHLNLNCIRFSNTWSLRQHNPTCRCSSSVTLNMFVTTSPVSQTESCITFPTVRPGRISRSQHDMLAATVDVKV